MKGHKTVRIVSQLVVAAFVVVLVGMGQPVAAVGDFKYVALGDSVASGHGIKPYGPTQKDKSCKRAGGTGANNMAYPHHVRDFLDGWPPINFDPANFRMLACSGAKVQALDGQVRQALDFIGKAGEPDESPAVATITIGANNLEFDQRSTYAMAFNPARYDDFVEFRTKQTNKIREELPGAIRKLFGSGDVERRVVVTTYYNPFNLDSVIYHEDWKAGCDLPVLNRPPCFQIIAETIQELNDAITDAAVSEGAEVVDGELLNILFLLHRSPRPYCGNADPAYADTYIQAKDTAPGDPQLNLKNPPKDGDDCFHPNLTGHEVIGDLTRQLLPYGS